MYGIYSLLVVAGHMLVTYGTNLAINHENSTERGEGTEHPYISLIRRSHKF